METLKVSCAFEESRFAKKTTRVFTRDLYSSKIWFKNSRGLAQISGFDLVLCKSY